MESEREKLERQIEHLDFIAGIPHANAHAVCAEIIAEKRAALAALDGPGEGYVRCESIIEIGTDGRYVVWERDTTSEKTNGEFYEWRKSARRVVFTVDVPIPTVQVVRGKVQP